MFTVVQDWRLLDKIDSFQYNDNVRHQGKIKVVERFTLRMYPIFQESRESNNKIISIHIWLDQYNDFSPFVTNVF